MTNKINLIQKLKFNLWYLSRIHPLTGLPIRILGKLYTSNFMQNYKNELKKIGLNNLPEDRYKREKNVPKQFFIINSNLNSFENSRAVEVLLNHFRIPFSLANFNDIQDSFFDDVDESIVVIGLKLTTNDVAKIKKILKDKIYKIIIFGPVKKQTDDSENIDYIDEDPIEMLPFNEGLRSDIVKKFTNILFKSKFLIVTGLMPAQVALRIDDVIGNNAKEYISTITKHNWMPNLGIFLDDFRNNTNNHSDFISKLNKNDEVEISPHAYSAKKFIFFDYPNGHAITKDIFENRWSMVENDFKMWGFKISSVLNAHFHTFSQENFELFRKKNIKYIFSEFFPSKMKPISDSMYLPSGDPLCTTGQITEENIIQMYSGDSSLCCNQISSFYDFLMHNDLSDRPSTAMERIKTRLDMSLGTGFASFFTTHEYLINNLSSEDLLILFDKMEGYINNNKFKPTKTNLTEIGRTCENHTNIIIYSIQKKDSKYCIKLKGKSNGDFYLTYFDKNEMKRLLCPSFEGENIVEIPL